MNITEIIEAVTIDAIEQVQNVVKKHFESGATNAPMNMVAFD